VIDWIAKKKWWMFSIILMALIAGLIDWWLFKRDHSQDKIILAAALKHGVDPALVKAVVWRESSFNPKARGTKGEIGLMQIGELAAQEWADAEKLTSFRHEDLFDPVKNAMAGTWYLAKMIRRYANTDSPYHYALADYNAGRTHVLRWKTGAASTNSQLFLQQMDYPGTRRYIQSILLKYQNYQKEFKKEPPKKL
jgi:soluble lytic murein transglycosylase